MSTTAIWDLCLLDAEQESCIRSIKASTKLTASSWEDAGEMHSGIDSSGGSNAASMAELDPMVLYSQENLISTEQSCKNFVRDLDGMIGMLDNIASAHSDVTGRTNSLMRNCEDLLERQVFQFVYNKMLHSYWQPRLLTCVSLVEIAAKHSWYTAINH